MGATVGGDVSVLFNALQVVASTGNVAAVSTPGLASRVRATQAQLQRKDPTIATKAGIVHVPVLSTDLTLRPLDALLELSLGTALRTPRLLAPFTRWWSVLRYLGLFDWDPSTNRLRLDSGAIADVGANQRRVISEEIGIGFAVLAAKQWVQARVPGVGPVSVMDVDRALFNGWVPGMQRAGKRQPDYLLRYEDPQQSGVSVYELLESKGTVSRSTVTRQLGRAATQLGGLLIGGRPITGLAVSTVSAADGVEIHAIDPVEPPVEWRRDQLAVESWRNVERYYDLQAPRIDVSPAPFFATAANVELGSLSQFAGLRTVARQWYPRFGSSTDGASDADAHRDYGGRTFVGEEFVAEVPGVADSRVRVFHGVDTNVAAALRDTDAEQVSGAQREFAKSRPLNSAPTETQPAAAAVSDVGAILEISLT